MEVKIKPVPGCANIFLSVVTLGVYPLMAWLNLWNWPKSVDEQGLVTHSGSRIAWQDFTKITKVFTTMNRGAVRTEHYELRHAGSKVIVAEYRLENGAQVVDYIWRHLPEQAKKTQ